MRILLLLAVLTMVGCAGGPSNSGRVQGNFDTVEAAKTRISLGLTYLKNGNYRQAKVNLDKAIEFAPRLADAQYSLAYYYQVVGENVLAEDAFQLAMDLDPRNADIANSYGAFLCQQGKYQEAKDYFLKAVNSSSYASTAESYENLALCSQSQGQIADGIEYLRLALNHQPSRAKSLLLLTQFLASENQWQEARDVLTRYERVSRVTPESLWLTIKVEQALGNVERAQGFGDMLVRMYPEHPNTLDYISRRAKASPPTSPVAKVEKVLSPQPEVESVEPEVVAEQEPEVSQPEAMATPEATSVITQPEPQAVADVVEEVVEDEPVAEAAAEQIPETSPDVFHVVQKDENLYRISLRYNLKMQRLIEWNDLDDASAIYAGMKLYVVDPQTIE